MGRIWSTALLLGVVSLIADALPDAAAGGTASALEIAATKDGAPTWGGFELEPPSLSFGMTRVGEVGDTETVVATNNASEPLTFWGARVGGQSAADFVVAYPAPLPVEVQPGQSTSFDVTFVPQEAGRRRSHLSLRRAAVRKTSTFRLSGLAFGFTGAELLLNAGRVSHQDAQMELWVPDFAYSGRTALNGTPEEIEGTVEDPLYQVVRSGSEFSYAFELPNGAYEVTLHFAEVAQALPGERIFNVEVEGERVIDGLDLAALVGPLTAFAYRRQVDLIDGLLDIALESVAGDAVVAAIEVRSLPIVEPGPALIDFGSVSQGDLVERRLDLINSGLHDGLASSVSLLVSGSDEHATGHDFYVEIDGVQYRGDHDDVEYAINLPIPAGGQTDVVVGFEPTEHLENQLLLRWKGNFATVDVTLTGIGSTEDWGYLHPVIKRVPELVVDYDHDSFEIVTLDAAESHTHEPGHSIAEYRWSVNDVVFSADGRTMSPFDLGDTEVELTVFDDNQPASEATAREIIRVFAADRVPGVLTFYYEASGGNAAELLEDPPSSPDFIERLPGLELATGSTVGGSPYTQDVLVRMNASFDVPQPDEYEFVATGGADFLIEVDGEAWTGPEVLSSGRHSIEARFVVQNLSDLPLEVEVTVGGQPAMDFDDELSHDENGVLPLIHEMPSAGNESGGNGITIKGFGFYPKDSVIVHWGNEVDSPDLGAADFSHYSPEWIEFSSPPSPGPLGVARDITVTIETAAGVSNERTFTYSPDGDVPIEFVELAGVSVPEPTTGEWGPDGRLYVGSLSGEITAITFDEDYSPVGVDTYLGVSALSNSYVLGMTFNPYDPDDAVKIYVSHSELWANGGGSFSGPSEYSGQVSILSGPDFDTPVPLITRLPVSNHDHGVNGLQFDHNGDLLISVGGNTNAGVRDPHLGDLPESPLSGAILKAETSRSDFNGELSYLLSNSGVPNNDQVFGGEVDVAPGTHVSVHAAGLRNSYDLVLTTWGYLYATDNGPDNPYGPASTDCQNDAGGGGPSPPNDEVLLIEYDNYYGHPNRNRGRYDPRQCIYRGESEHSIPGEFIQAIGFSRSSVNGICEYRASAFNGQMRGDLLIQKFGFNTRRVRLGADKRSVESITDLNPVSIGLDVTTGPGGSILAMDHLGNRVNVLVPNDAAATGLTVYDIYPWRAPSSGGRIFVIGGEGFGTLANTGVTIGGSPATLTSVSAKRIEGVVPADLSAEMKLLDVTVQVGLDVATLSEAFMALPAVPGEATGFWRTGAEPPEATGEVAAGVIDGVMYLVGEGATSSDKTYAYDILNDTWTDDRPLRPFAGHHHSAEVVDGKLFLIGGLYSGQGKVQIFDPSAGSDGVWIAGAGLPWPGGSVSTAVIGGKIYAAGGIVGSSTVGDAAVYDPVGDSWSLLAPMPTPVNHAAASTDGEKLYVFGGRQGGNVPQPGFDTVQVYDPATDSWESSDEPSSSLAPMPSGRGGTGKAVFFKGEFYVMGGETSDPNDPEADPGRVFAQVLVYDPVANTWRLDASMPTPRHGIYPVLFQSRMFVVGGGVQYGHSQSTVNEIFSR